MTLLAPTAVVAVAVLTVNLRNPALLTHPLVMAVVVGVWVGFALAAWTIHR